MRMFEWKVGNGMERKFAIARIYLLALLLAFVVGNKQQRDGKRFERINIKFTALAFACHHPLESDSSFSNNNN